MASLAAFMSCRLEGAQIMGSGSLDGSSAARLSRPPAASSGLAARYCRKRRRLAFRSCEFMGFPCETTFEFTQVSTPIRKLSRALRRAISTLRKHEEGLLELRR